jgi:hypothetical protein
MKTSKDHKNINNFHEKEILRVKKGRKKRRTELERLRRLEVFLRETSPEKLNAFNKADQTHLNTCGADINKNPSMNTYDTKNPISSETMWNHSTDSQASAIAPQTDEDTLIDEMFQTYNIHLTEFDLNLFENLC